MSRRSYVACILYLAAAALAAGLFRGSSVESGGDFVFNESVVRRVRDRILASYVEDMDDFDRKLYYGALSGMTAVLDPHSQFLTPEERSDLEIDTTGKFGGLGIVIEKPAGRDGPIVIVTPFLGTPASQAGLRPGDRIVEIEGESTIGMDLTEAVQKLRGEPGTVVKVKIQRGVEALSRAMWADRLLQGCRLVTIDGEGVAERQDSDIREVLQAKRGRTVTVTIVPEKLDKPEDVPLTRAEISVPNIEFSRMVDREAGVGYIHLSRFQEDTHVSLSQAIAALRREGMKALVLDLRRNPGGLLAAAIRTAGLFLREGEPVVSTRARETDAGARPETVYRSTTARPITKEELALAVLVDGSSASASEILAAAIKDNRRGLVVGSRTFGKGSVQKLFDVDLGPDPKTRRPLEGWLKLTTEKYYTPSGECIERQPKSKTWGVEPDVAVEMTDEQLSELMRQWEKDKLAEMGTGKPEEGERRIPDPQLERAVEILKAHLVLSRAPAAEPAAPLPAGTPAAPAPVR